MTAPVGQWSFVAGEVSPSIFGRPDLARYHAAASTMRNGFPSFRGGYYSRAGTRFVGFSKQTGRSFPPRLIPFQFSINQGLALEFGNFYMRVISEGGFVTEPPISITGITNAKPAVMTIAAFSVASATANNGAVSASYNPGDSITIAGGAGSQAAVLRASTTALASLALTNPTGPLAASGVGYAPGDILTLAGGSTTTRPTVIVNTTLGCSQNPAGNWVILDGGLGGAPGPVMLTGTTGTGTKYQVNGTINGMGRLVSLGTMVVAGNYTVNPGISTFSGFGDPVTGGGLIGAVIVVGMGIRTLSILNPGTFAGNPFAGHLTQASTTGTQGGATFTGIFGPGALSVTTPGVYASLPANPAAQAATTGTGLGATFNLGSVSATFNTGDWTALANIGGMTQLGGQTVVLSALTATTYSLSDVYGNPIDTTAFPAYTNGGTAARIFTLTTPYSETDLKYIKSTQSADVMSICCVNQQTGVEYAPQDLSRITDSNWTFTAAVPAPSVTAPTGAAASASSGGGVAYAYAVTAVSPTDGTESIASNIATVGSAVDIAATVGQINIVWAPVPGVGEYNVYKATPSLSGAVPTGSLFGYAGTTYGVSFNDPNIIADFSQVPPQHKNPFARGQIIGAIVTASSGTVSGATFTINTSTGSGAILVPVIVANVLVAVLADDNGENYAAVDTVTVNVTGGGTATVNLSVGAQSGTYPAVPAYFQERRCYAYTLNNPDTYFMSEPGAFTNFDFRIPTIPSDAIIGSPWAVEVNGIQWMIQTAGGLLVFTGLSTWLLVGAGSFATNVQPISPASQDVVPQPEIGCAATLMPIKVDYDVLFVDQKQAFYYDLPYQLYALSTPLDISENSIHLFTGFTVLEHAWCRAPSKLLWAVRSDGTMLSLTYYKTEQVAGWARHDTQGFFASACSVTEPPVDALYVATQRFPGANTAYMIERMDNRLWSGVERCWCVDAGLSLPQPAPDAALTASSAVGLGAVTGVSALVGGQNYSAATFGTVVDMGTGNGPGPGTGAVPTLTIVGGVITNVGFAPGQQGTKYLYPALIITDPGNQGSGASAVPTLNNAMTFTATVPVFSAPNVGSVIRAGGGIAVITQFLDTEHVTANMLVPITTMIPNTGLPAVFISGNWTMTAPVTTISGLNHLIGATVTGLADGNVIPPTVVSAQGTIPIPLPANPNVSGATAVIVGLGFQPQLQSIYLDAGQPTVQGQRKKIAAVTARLEASRGIKIGSNQPDGSTQSPPVLSPTWQNLADVPDDGPNFPLAPYNAIARPLRTGDIRVPVQGGFQTNGQVCFQQDNPLPMNILCGIEDVLPGDDPQTEEPKKPGR